MATYSVHVSNIGIVLDTNERVNADVKFDDYVLLSQGGSGRVGGQSVRLFMFGELVTEYLGPDEFN